MKILYEILEVMVGIVQYFINNDILYKLQSEWNISLLSSFTKSKPIKQKQQSRAFTQSYNCESVKIFDQICHIW